MKDLCLCLIHDRLGSTPDAWIGLTKEHNNCGDSACREWMWADETTYSFSNWTSDEPAQDEFYASLGLSDPGWQGIKSHTKKPYICEYGKKNPPT